MSPLLLSVQPYAVQCSAVRCCLPNYILLLWRGVVHCAATARLCFQLSHSGSKELKLAKNKFTSGKYRQKLTWFPFPVRPYASYSKVVKLLQGISSNQSFSRIFWISFLAGFCYLSRLYAIGAACFGLLLLHWSVRACLPAPLDAFLDSILKEEFQREAAKFSLQLLHIMYCRVAEHYLNRDMLKQSFSFFSPREIGVKNCADYLY